LFEGVFYSGNWERHFRKLALSLKRIRPHLLQELFEINDVVEQERFWKNKWSTYSWKVFLKLLSSSFVWKYLLRDPGFYKYVPKGFSVSTYFEECFASGASHFLFSESPFLHLLFFGKIPLAHLPPHLQEEHFSSLKERAGKVEVVTSSLSDFLNASPSQSVDGFSLSDFSSYTSIEEYEKTWNALFDVAKEGARFVERQFLVKRKNPFYVQIDSHAIERLEREDQSLFYTFFVGSKQSL